MLSLRPISWLEIGFVGDGKDDTGLQVLEVQHKEFRLLGWFGRAQ